MNQQEPKSESPICIECDGEVILIEGWDIAPGYGYGYFQCQKCGTESSYYGEGIKPTKVKEERDDI